MITFSSEANCLCRFWGGRDFILLRRNTSPRNYNLPCQARFWGSRRFPVGVQVQVSELPLGNSFCFCRV